MAICANSLASSLFFRSLTTNLRLFQMFIEILLRFTLSQLTALRTLRVVLVDSIDGLAIHSPRRSSQTARTQFPGLTDSRHASRRERLHECVALGQDLLLGDLELALAVRVRDVSANITCRSGAAQSRDLVKVVIRAGRHVANARSSSKHFRTGNLVRKIVRARRWSVMVHVRRASSNQLGVCGPCVLEDCALLLHVRRG